MSYSTIQYDSLITRMYVYERERERERETYAVGLTSSSVSVLAICFLFLLSQMTMMATNRTTSTTIPMKGHTAAYLSVRSNRVLELWDHGTLTGKNGNTHHLWFSYVTAKAFDITVQLIEINLLRASTKKIGLKFLFQSRL